MRNWLEDKWIILSGASSGIGRELCKLLITKYGARVIGIGRNEEKMLSLQSELGEKADKFQYRLFDVAHRQGWIELRDWLNEQSVQPSVLINNAGVFPSFSKVVDIPSQTVEKVIQTNFYSIVYSTEILYPVLKGSKKDKPAVINISSSAALCAVAGTAAYSASKAAVKGYTEAFALEEKGKAYVGLVHPGTTATELFSGDENTKNSALDKIAMPAPKMAKKIAKRILRKKRRSVVGWDAKMMNWLTKCMPVKGLFLVRGVLKASKSKVFSNVFNEREKSEE